MNFALTALDRDIFPAKRYENFLCKFRLNNTHLSAVHTRKLKQQLQQNDITYVVSRSLVASEQEIQKFIFTRDR